MITIVLTNSSAVDMYSMFFKIRNINLVRRLNGTRGGNTKLSKCGGVFEVTVLIHTYIHTSQISYTHNIDIRCMI